jgi:hypothetical protein
MTDRGDGMSWWFVSNTVNSAQHQVETRNAYMIVDLPKHLLGCYYQAHDLPYSHLKVHLWKLEHALEEARHLDLIPP